MPFSFPVSGEAESDFLSADFKLDPGLNPPARMIVAFVHETAPDGPLLREGRSPQATVGDGNSPFPFDRVDCFGRIVPRWLPVTGGGRPHLP